MKLLDKDQKRVIIQLIGVTWKSLTTQSGPCQCVFCYVHKQ